MNLAAFARLATARPGESPPRDPPPPQQQEDDFVDDPSVPDAIMVDSPAESDAEGRPEPSGNRWASFAIELAEADQSRKRKMTAKARASKARKVEEKSSASMVSKSMVVAQRLCAAPGAAGASTKIRVGATKPQATDLVTVAMSQAKFTEVKAASLQVLSYLPRARGRLQGAALLWQKKGAALMASCIEETQRSCFGRFAEHLGLGVQTALGEGQQVSAILGINCMWDEASQKLRSTGARRTGTALTKSRQTNMPVATSTMVSLARLHLDVVGGGRRTQKWEPWVMPIRFLPKNNMNFILHGLLTSFPLPLESPDKLKPLVDPFGLVWQHLGFDSAQANIALYKFLLDLAEEQPPHVVLHGEPCAMHQVHLVKASAVDVGGMAAMLYSSSKLLRLNSTLNGVRDSIHDLLLRRISIVYEVAPPVNEDTELVKLCHLIFNIDGDETLIYTNRNGKRSPTAFLQDVQELSGKVKYDKERKKWIYFVWSHEESLAAARDRTTMPTVTHDDAVTTLAIKLQSVLFGQAWPVGAVSRWTHIVEALKRTTFGAALGNILILAFASLGDRMSLDEATVQAQLETKAAAKAQGREVDDRWEKHCSRIIRVSKFWGTDGKQWQTAVVLICTVAVDRLAQNILGRNHHSATLASMVDPGKSVVAKTVAFLLQLMTEWDDNGSWQLLNFMQEHDGQWQKDPQVRGFARRQLFALSSGLFYRLVLRFSTYPYKLQWLISDETTEEDRRQMCEDFIAYPEECLSKPCRRLRRLAPDAAFWQGEIGKRIVEMMNKSMTFSTHPVEVEHKLTKEELSSISGGAAHSHVGNRTAARQYRMAFIAKGNPDPIGLKRSTQTARSAPHTGGEGPAPRALTRPLEVAAPALEDEPRLMNELVPAAVGSRRVDIAAIMDQLGGGNPKVMYINWQIRQIAGTHVASSGKRLSKREIEKLRQDMAENYDKSKTTRENWKAIYHLVQHRRTQEVQGNAVGPPSGSPRLQDRVADSVRLWAESVEDPEKYQHLPMHPQVLTHHFAEKYKTQDKLKEHSNNSSPYVMSHDDTPDRLSGFRWSGGGPLFGCDGSALNVCHHRLPIAMQENFARHHHALSSFIDKVRKNTAMKSQVFCFSQAEVAKHTIVVFGHAVFSPKFQVYIRCAVERLGDVAPPNPFEHGDIGEFPVVLKMLTRPSPLAIPGRPKFFELYHETSHELVKRLVEEGRDSVWSVRSLAWEETDHADLLHMKLVGWDGEAVLLQPAARANVFNASAFNAWKKCQPGSSSSARASGTPRAATTSTNTGRVRSKAPLALQDVADEQQATFDDDHAEVADLFLSEVNLAGSADAVDEEVLEAMEEICEDIAESVQRPVHTDEGTDAAAEAHHPETTEDLMLSKQLEVLGGPAGEEVPATAASDEHPNPPSSSATLAVGQPTELSDAGVSGSGASSSAGALAPVSGTVVLEMSERGYVTDVAPPNRLYGRVTSWKTSISARCALHSKCSWAKTTKKASASDMVAWLAKGKPLPRGATSAEEAALRDEHLQARPS